jgi:hypothetical protein
MSRASHQRPPKSIRNHPGQPPSARGDLSLQGASSFSARPWATRKNHPSHVVRRKRAFAKFLNCTRLVSVTLTVRRTEIQRRCPRKHGIERGLSIVLVHTSHGRTSTRRKRNGFFSSLNFDPSFHKQSEFIPRSQGGEAICTSSFLTVSPVGNSLFLYRSTQIGQADGGKPLPLIVIAIATLSSALPCLGCIAELVQEIRSGQASE